MFHYVAQTGRVSDSFRFHTIAHQAAEDRAKRSNFYHYLLADEHRSWVESLPAEPTYLQLQRLANIDLRPAYERGRSLIGY